MGRSGVHWFSAIPGSAAGSRQILRKLRMTPIREVFRTDHAHALSSGYTLPVPRSIAQEQDILKSPPRKAPPRPTSRRIGIHTSIAGGVQNAAERAYRLGCSAFQIFSSSPRQWAPYELNRPQCDEMKRLREKYDLKPLVIHTNYLINMASMNDLFLKK
jgi:hypothetical protein